MNGLNKCIFVGTLGKDPELKTFADGGSVLNFSIAVNESWFDKTSNERKTRVEWVNIAVRGKRAVSLATLLEKGKQVCIEGQLRTRSWDDKSGTKRYITEVHALEIILLGGKGGSQGERKPSGGGSSSDDSGSYLDPQDDSDIPF